MWKRPPVPRHHSPARSQDAKVLPLGLRQLGRVIARSHAIAGMFVSIFEGELGHAQIYLSSAQALNLTIRSYCSLGRVRKRQLETKFASKIERDPAVFGGVRGREKAAVFPVLHVFAVRLQNARGRTGLTEKLRAIL